MLLAADRVMAEKTALLRALKTGVLLVHPGVNVWATPDEAKRLIDTGHAELVDDVPAPAQDGSILRRSAEWPLNRFSTVEPLWLGKPVVLLGGGSSLTPEQVEQVRVAREATGCAALRSMIPTWSRRGLTCSISPTASGTRGTAKALRSRGSNCRPGKCPRGSDGSPVRSARSAIPA
jgi:hypothetical protein